MGRTKLFTPGPVPIDEHILQIGAQQPPYNRTQEFSDFTFEILANLQYVFQTSGQVAIFSASGTAAMEATVVNFVDSASKVLIINCGTFGQRWIDLCDVYSISYEEFRLEPGQSLDMDELQMRLKEGRFSTLFATAHETSTGFLSDIERIGKLTRQYKVLYVVDGISSILADQFLMDEWNVDVAVLSSQKALALPPGLSFVAVGERAREKLVGKKCRSLYFDLENYFRNQERGQLPYTPAICLMRQLHERLRNVKEQTLPQIIQQHKDRADFFRDGLKSLPLQMVTVQKSNAMTALSSDKFDALKIVSELDKTYQMTVAPNTGELRHRVFRVAHMGAQTLEDLSSLLSALDECLSNPATSMTN
ncbi:MAG: alanine--glyoxylate aminotransferase family protein [Candidatus Melainabacteria bacterium]|nr:alanine--glyoxylate aminotransferase family protein [Candidatus Melainabacteria bacterium]